MDEEERQTTRRSARIIALEERKAKEKAERAAARKNKITNNNNNNNGGLNKGKGKAIMVEEYDDDNNEDDDDDDDDEYVVDEEDEHYVPQRKKGGRKTKPLDQLMSSSQTMQGGQNRENTSTSRRNGPPKIPEKNVLEFMIDLLQRKDTEELFAEPVKENEVEGYYEIVKRPMDFGTMRAKLHENMYTEFEEFKRDVYLICANAMIVNPANSAYHKAAETINEYATRLFHAMAIDPENFEKHFNPNKKRKGRKPNRPKNSGRQRHFAPKPADKSCGANSKGAEVEVDKRSSYSTPHDNSLMHQILNQPKENPVLNLPASNYPHSVSKFVEDMGDVAKSVAADKIKCLASSESESAPPTPTLDPISQYYSFAEADAAAAYYDTQPNPSSNRPLTIPGPPPPEPRNTTRNSDKGKQVITCEDRPRAPLMSPYAGESSSTCTHTFNPRSWTSALSTALSNRIQNFISRTTTSDAAVRDLRPAPPLGFGPPYQYRSQVLPTCVITSSHPKPHLASQSRPVNDLSNLAQVLDLRNIPPRVPSFTDYDLSTQSRDLLSQMKPPPDEPLTNYDFSSLSRPERSALTDPFDINRSLQSIISHFKPQLSPAHSNNVVGPSFQQNPMTPWADPMNSSNYCVQPQPMTGCNMPWNPFGSEPMMTSYTIPEQPLLNQVNFGEPIPDHFNLSESLPKPMDLMNDYNQSYMLPPLNTGYSFLGEPVPEDYIPPPPIESYFDDFAMQLDPEPEPEPEPMPMPAPLSPLGLFPEQEPTRLPSTSSYAAALEMPLGLGLGHDGVKIEGAEEADDHPNLSLQL